MVRPARPPPRRPETRLAWAATRGPAAALLKRLPAFPPPVPSPPQLAGYELELSEINESGYKWVNRNGNRWSAMARLNGQKAYIGTFDTPEAAALAIAIDRASALQLREAKQIEALAAEDLREKEMALVGFAH